MTIFKTNNEEWDYIKVRLIDIMFNSRVSSQKLGATDTALCCPSLNEVKQNWRN
jgi:hypothetical protein